MQLNELFSVHGKVALVTGGSRGIGYMIAEGLLSAGAKVYICARNAAKLEEAASRLSAFGDVVTIPADLSTEEGINALVAAIVAKETKLDLLVNNAGAVAYRAMEDITRDEWDAVLALNITAPFDLTRKLLPLLRAAARADDPARVVNIASVDALKISRFDSYPYAASKSGLVHLTRVLASRLASDFITVNAIAPGLFQSEMTDFLFTDGAVDAKALNIPLQRAGRPTDIAGAILFLASEAGSYVTGVTLPVSGGSATAQ